MNIAEIAKALGKPQRDGRGWKALCPAHADHNPSLSLDEKDGRILVKCHTGCPQSEVIAALQQRGLWPSEVHQLGRAYDYTDEHGALRYQVVRRAANGSGKKFVQRRPDGAGGWIWNMSGVTPLPYRLPGLLASRGVVFVPEGEKDVDNLHELDLTATTNHGGAGKWRSELCRWLAGRDVVILPDNDQPGRDHAESVAKQLTGIAARIRVLELPDLAPKGDVSDWLAASGTREQLLELAEAAPDWWPAPAAETVDDDTTEAEIARLAKLKSLSYERQRQEAAKRLGIRASLLDRLVALERGIPVEGQGEPIHLNGVEPWAEPVDGAKLIDDIAKAVRRFVVLGSAEADAVALWVVVAHRFEVLPIMPRLTITAPEMQSGKTTLLHVIAQLVPRPLKAENITAAALFRTINITKPTLLLDEADSYVKESEEIRGIINAGHRADGSVIRTIGDNHEPRSFSVYSPMALAGIGKLQATIMDRSVAINLRRRRKDEACEPLRADRPQAELHTLSRMAARWTADCVDRLKEADPEFPELIINRTADNWRPLLALADLAGGDWPRRVRQIAVTLFLNDAADSESRGVQLLADIRLAFSGKNTDRLKTQELLDYLLAQEDRPWPEMGRTRKPLTVNQLARLLKPFNLSPTTIRFPDGSTPRGYYKSAFEDAFARYLPRDTPF